MYFAPDNPEFEPVRVMLDEMGAAVRKLDPMSQADYWLGKLEELNEKAGFSDTSIAYHLTRAHIYLELGRLNLSAHAYNDAIACLAIALDEARSINDPKLQYLVLHSLGLCYLALTDYSKACHYLQMSLKFANHVTHIDAAKTLEFVAICWQEDQSTVLNAAALYDWLSVLQPTWIFAQIEKYRCLIAGGREASVLSDAAVRSSSDYTTLVKVIAANAALKKTRVACRIAREALKIADDADDELWRITFSGFLSKCKSGAGAVRVAPRLESDDRN